LKSIALFLLIISPVFGAMSMTSTAGGSDTALSNLVRTNFIIQKNDFTNLSNRINGVSNYVINATNGITSSDSALSNFVIVTSNGIMAQAFTNYTNNSNATISVSNLLISSSNALSGKIDGASNYSVAVSNGVMARAFTNYTNNSNAIVAVSNLTVNSSNALFIRITNEISNASNYLQSQISGGGINSATATNISIFTVSNLVPAMLTNYSYLMFSNSVGNNFNPLKVHIGTPYSTTINLATNGNRFIGMYLKVLKGNINWANILIRPMDIGMTNVTNWIGFQNASNWLRVDIKMSDFPSCDWTNFGYFNFSDNGQTGDYAFGIDEIWSYGGTSNDVVFYGDNRTNVQLEVASGITGTLLASNGFVKGDADFIQDSRLYALSNALNSLSNYAVSSNFQQSYFFFSLLTNTMSTNATNFSHQNKWFTPTNLNESGANALSNIMPAGTYHCTFIANASGANAATVVRYAFVTNGGIVSNSIMEFNAHVANDLSYWGTDTFITIPANCLLEVQMNIVTPGATGAQVTMTRPRIFMEREY
jgi:hypothetical protein